MLFLRVPAKAGTRLDTVIVSCASQGDVMLFKKLFQLLVVGGAVLGGTSACSTTASSQSVSDKTASGSAATGSATSAACFGWLAREADPLRVPRRHAGVALRAPPATRRNR